jgi:hypothetical protein
MKSLVTSIVVDFRHVRCENCKVALHDELATLCPVCGAVFDSIMSNHAGLAARFERKREDAGVRHCDVQLSETDEDAVELVGA